MSEQTIEIPVGAFMDASDDAPVVARPAAVDSPLAGLRERRERLVTALWVDLRVPRWDEDGGPSIWVRYKPSRPGHVQAAVDKRFKQKSTLGIDWLDYANADVLIDCCLGVFAKDEQRIYSLRPGDPDGDWTKFDPDLAQCLGIETRLATDVVRALYLTSADMTTAVNQLTDWSGQESGRVEKDAQGN